MSLRRSSSEPTSHLQSTLAFPEINFLSSGGAPAGASPDAAINFDDSDTASMFLRPHPGSPPALVASAVARIEISRTTPEQDSRLDCPIRRPRSSSFGDITTVELPVLAWRRLRPSDMPQVADQFHQAQEATLGGEMGAFSQTTLGEAVQPERATSLPTTTGEAGHHHPPANTAAHLNNSRTAPGTCMVCLSECQETLGAAWLHPEETISESGTPCTVSACLPCLKTYFEGIVAGGFDGSCPRMRCMCCPRVVCETVWAPLVSPSVVETFRRRAKTLLSLQCGNCDARGSVMAMPPPGRPYSSTLVSSMAALVGVLRQDQGKPDNIRDNSSNPSAIEGSKIRSASTQAFRRALRRYASGQDVDVAKFYEEVESLVCAGLGGEDVYDVRYPRMVDVLRCVEDSERRASLHLRYFHFHPMIKTKCCNSEHCFRCRIQGGHLGMTCKQFEASRGHVDVFSCPECGVSLTKGDGCNNITCVCGACIDWNEVMRERMEQAVSVLRIAYPEDTAREVVRIIRAERPTADDRRGDEVESLPVAAEREAGEDPEQGQPPVEPERNHAQVERNVTEPVPEPVPETPILQRGSEEEYRLANMFQDLFPDEVDHIRAIIFAEEHPQFTVLHAISLVMRLSPSQVYPQPFDYFGRCDTSSSCWGAHAEREWQESSAYTWFRRNQTVHNEFRLQAMDAQLLLVEAFFGNDDDNDVIAHVAAEHSRAAMRFARAEQPEEPLFSWLGIPDYSTEETEEMGMLDSIPEELSEWTAPFANADIEDEKLLPLPPPIILWGPQPPRGYAVPPAAFKPGPVTRKVSTVSCFGSKSLVSEVTEWLASSTPRQRRLRYLMGREEDRLSKAWIALWGRRQCQRAGKSALEKLPTVYEEREVAAAARRCAFLDAYPEHACAEQSSMMKAFVRRNYSAVEIARAEAIAQRASAWEEMISSTKSSGDSVRGERGGDASPVSFRRAYTAYVSHVEKAARAGYLPNGMKYPPSPETKGIKRDKTAKAGKSDCRRRGRGNEALQDRIFDCLTTAWGKHNRQRVAAQRFADAHDPSGSSDHQAVALVAVIALVLVPMLMEKTKMMCHCDINPVERDAEDWKALNRAEYDKALEDLNARLETGIRVLEGCECNCEENIIACSHLVACPVITRRLLGIPNPMCCNSAGRFHGEFEDGFLDALFQ